MPRDPYTELRKHVGDLDAFRKTTLDRQQAGVKLMQEQREEHAEQVRLAEQYDAAAKAQDKARLDQVAAQQAESRQRFMERKRPLMEKLGIAMPREE